MREVSNYQMVRGFHQAMGQVLDYPFQPNDATERLLGLRLELLNEEHIEVEDAETVENLLKELCDVLYVVYGFAATFGWDIDEAFARVHKSNMSKLGDDGRPVYRADGKVMKGPNYKPADLADLVR